jgi:hypothetical protein
MRNHVCNNHHRHSPPRGADPLHRRLSQAADTVRPAKLAAWERSNGVGRLVKKEPPRVYPTWTAPASFTLHEGNFSSDGVILVTIMRSHSADSRLIFEVAEEPKVGQVRVLLDFGGNTELLHLAESITSAELWIAREGYRNARLEIVGAEEGDRAGGADLAA